MCRIEGVTNMGIQEYVSKLSGYRIAHSVNSS